MFSGEPLQRAPFLFHAESRLASHARAVRGQPSSGAPLAYLVLASSLHGLGDADLLPMVQILNRSERLCRDRFVRAIDALFSRAFRLLVLRAIARGGLPTLASMLAVAKRPRLDTSADPSWLRSLLHRGGISRKGLEELLRELATFTELPGGASGWKLRGENNSKFMGLRVALPMRREGGGEPFQWEFADPAKLLAFSVAASPCLARAFADAVREHPPDPERPWRAVVGFDEFAPGDKLNVDNRRKAMVLSFSFLELGRAALTSEWAWFTPVVLRSREISKVSGGWPACLAAFLKTFLLGVSGIATAGVPLALPDGPVLLFARCLSLS